MNHLHSNTDISSIKSNYDIEFLEELSNDSIIFKIVDRYGSHAGHAILTFGGKITIVEKAFFDFSKDDKLYLHSKVDQFATGIN